MRLVAREFRTSSTNETNFAPTSAFSAVRMLLIFAMMYNLAVTVLEISDAFLMVPQVEIMFVEIPQWVRELTQRDETHRRLLKCLPGQRNSALRWHLPFAQICEGAGLKTFPGTPTVMRHGDLDRKVFINVHVDDILLICKPEDVPWFQQTVGATFEDESGWAPFAGKWRSDDVFQEAHYHEGGWHTHSTKCHLCAEADFSFEGGWTQKERITLPCDAGIIQRRPCSRCWKFSWWTSSCV